MILPLTRERTGACRPDLGAGNHAKHALSWDDRLIIRRIIGFFRGKAFLFPIQVRYLTNLALFPVYLSAFFPGGNPSSPLSNFFSTFTGLISVGEFLYMLSEVLEVDFVEKCSFSILPFPLTVISRLVEFLIIECPYLYSGPVPP